MATRGRAGTERNGPTKDKSRKESGEHRNVLDAFCDDFAVRLMVRHERRTADVGHSVRIVEEQWLLQ